MSKEELCEDISVEGNVENGSQVKHLWEKENETVGLEQVFRFSTHN